MRNFHSTVACSLLAMLGVRVGLAVDAPRAVPAGPTTQPAPAEKELKGLLADPKAEAEERHKHFDPRWLQIAQSQKNSIRNQWKDAKIVQTYKSGEIAHLSLANGVLKVETLDIAVPSMRVAVEGSKSIWVVNHTRMWAGGIAGKTLTDFATISRYDLDAKNDEFWHTRIFVRDRAVNLIAQSIYGSTTILQNAGLLNVRVMEYGQMGQAQKTIFTAQASSLVEMRSEHPQEFRLYVMPVLAKFSDLTFLQPGPADVYPVFGEIQADQKLVQELAQLIPQLDADDPIDRDAATARLFQLGRPAVLAALRVDESDLSEEQKLRLKTFVSTFRRRPPGDPALLRHDLGFLIDCLEFEDPAVRSAARAELKKQTAGPIDFDVKLTGDAAVESTDALRKRLLAPPPPKPSVPATAPAPQV